MEMLDSLEEEYGVYIDPDDFGKLLAEYGLMIVPIEDPTNLRFGDE